MLFIPPTLSRGNYRTRDEEISAGAARSAIAKIENQYFQVLSFDLFDMLIAEIAVQYGEILGRAWHYIVGTERPIPKANVLVRRSCAAAPLAFDGDFAGHVMV